MVAPSHQQRQSRRRRRDGRSCARTAVNVVNGGGACGVHCPSRSLSRTSVMQRQAGPGVARAGNGQWRGRSVFDGAEARFYRLLMVGSSVAMIDTVPS